MKETVKTQGQGKLFRYPFLEVFTKAPPLVSACVYATVVIILLYKATSLSITDQAGKAILIFIGAFFSWTLFEYFAHRYLFHLDVHFPNSKLAAKLAYVFHGIHHEFPHDTNRILMPPLPGLIILSILFLFFSLLLGSYVYLFIPGFMTGYLTYTFVHFQTHALKVPSFLKKQKKHHALHHYKFPDKAFGVSSPLWDWVFGTMPPAK
ncbi:MAG: fatty acid hydroxylase [Saprospiraceae bacterium]|nr:fatty acid hydroxylase [Saprospiraceae bacterium]